MYVDVCSGFEEGHTSLHLPSCEKYPSLASPPPPLPPPMLIVAAFSLCVSLALSLFLSLSALGWKASIAAKSGSLPCHCEHLVCLL